MPSGAEDLFKYTIADKSDVIVATLKTDGVNEKNYYYGDNGEQNGFKKVSRESNTY